MSQKELDEIRELDGMMSGMGDMGKLNLGGAGGLSSRGGSTNAGDDDNY